MEIKWTKLAQEDLECIQKYICDDNPTIAKKVILHIIDKVETMIPTNPSVGRPGRVLGTRELIIAKYPYTVPYRVKGNEVHSLRVLHASRKWEN